MLTVAEEGGRGVRQMLTLADKGGRGGKANADIGRQRGKEFWLQIISLTKWLKITK